LPFTEIGKGGESANKSGESNGDCTRIPYGLCRHVRGADVDGQCFGYTNTVPSTVTGGSLGVSIFLLNDTKLADNNDDLWDGSIDVFFNRTELDDQLGADSWTGSETSGIKSAAGN